MGKVKYFKTLPENQKYLYKGFASVGKKEGMLCDECGAYIQNIVTVVGSVDHIDYHLGLTCCEKQAKIDNGVDLDDNVTMKVKFWKSRLAKLAKFRKDFDHAHREDTIAIQGEFWYNPREKQAKLDFGFLYENGDWYWMHDDFPITKIYNKVKETFADIWDQVDWMGMDECAKMETSAEVYQTISSGKLKLSAWNEWCKIHYSEWDQKSDVRRAVESAIQASGYSYGKDKAVKLPQWFDPTDYQQKIFDEIVNDLADNNNLYRSEDLKVTEFVVTNEEALKRQKLGDAYKSKKDQVLEVTEDYKAGKITVDEFIAKIQEIEHK